MQTRPAFGSLVRWTAVLLLWAALSAVPVVRAQTLDPVLAQEFDARSFVPDELRLLQWALSLSGDYNGLLDGHWGQRSQLALERFTARQFTDLPRNVHLPTLAIGLVDALRDDGWQFTGYPGYGGSILFPMQTALPQQATGSFENWQHANSSLRYGFALTRDDALAGFHGYVDGLGPLQDPLYRVRRADRVVTSAVLRAGGRVYMRSDKVGGVWRTVVLTADHPDRHLLASVAASITADAPDPLYLPENGQLLILTERLIAGLDRDTAMADRPTDPPAPPERSGTGSGFLVTADGLGLTNQHVVDGCRRITANGQPATVIAVSALFDLALIRLTERTGCNPPFSPTGPQH